MGNHPDRFKKNDYILIFSILTLLTYIALFVLRPLDDNRLTSWQWAFSHTDAAGVFLVLIFSLLPAYLLSAASFVDKHPLICLFPPACIIALLFWTEPEVIVDASRYFTQAKHLELYGAGYFLREWGRDIMAWTDMPLVPFLYGLIFRLFGESRIYIQIFNTFLFSMTVVLTYLTGKTLWDKDTGFLAGLMLLGIPYLFSQVPLMLVDVPAMFFLALSVFTFIKALTMGGIWTALCSVSVFLTFYSKYSVWLMLSLLFIIFLVHIKIAPEGQGKTLNYRHRRAVLKNGLMVFLAAAFMTGAFFWYKSDVFLEQIKLLLNFQQPGLKRWGEGFLSTFFFQIHPFITVLALYSTYIALKKRDLKYVIIGYTVFLMVLLQIKRIRYLIPVFPMLVLMASYGLQALNNRGIRKFVVFCIVFSSLVTARFAFLPLMEKTSSINKKTAGEYLNSLTAKDIEVFTMPPADAVTNPSVSVPILDLFTQKKIIYHYKPDFSISSREIKISPLRFTWEYKNPGYYMETLTNSHAVVVISNKNAEKLPHYIEQRVKNFQTCKRFDVIDNIFGYQTIVTVCHD